jgi:hypothetical protein
LLAGWGLELECILSLSEIECLLIVLSTPFTVSSGDVASEVTESDARSSSPLKIHPPATPSDAIAVRTIRNIKHRISYSTTEPQSDSLLVNRYLLETFSPGRLSELGG